MNPTLAAVVDLAYSDMNAALTAMETLDPTDALVVLNAIAERPSASPRANRVRAMAIASALEGAAMVDQGLDRDYLRTPQDRARWAATLDAVVCAYNRGQYDEVRAFAAGHVGRIAALWIWLHTSDRPDQGPLLLAVLRNDADAIQHIRDRQRLDARMRRQSDYARPRRAVPGKRILVSPRTGLTSLDRADRPQNRSSRSAA